MANPRSKRGAKNWFRDESSGVPAPQQGRGAENTPSYPASYFGPLSHFFHDMDRMFDHTFRQFGLPSFAGAPGVWGMPMFRPNMDIASNDNAYIITMEVPGMEEGDIRLTVNADGALTICGEKRQENAQERQDVVSSECSYGSFERSISLPDDVDEDGIEARFRNGVLTIHCPRAASPKQHSRQIPIQGGQESRGERPSGQEGGRGERPSGGQGPRKAA